MKRTPPPSDDSWESDAVWKLLDQVPPKVAPSRFVEETVRAARLLPESAPWWRRIFAPAPLIGCTTAVAAMTFAFISLVPRTTKAPMQAAVLDSPQAVAIQDIAETEALIAAADRLDDFSDNELVSLIGL